MPENFKDIQGGIDDAQMGIDSMDGKFDGQVFDNNEYAKVFIKDVDDFQSWVENLQPPEGMSPTDFNALQLAQLIALRDILLNFDTEGSLKRDVLSLSSSLKGFREKINESAVPTKRTGGGTLQTDESHEAKINLGDVHPPGFARLTENNDTEAVLSQYSMQEKLNILAELSEGAELTQNQAMRLEQLNMVVTGLTLLSEQLNDLEKKSFDVVLLVARAITGEDKVSQAREFVDKTLELKVSEWASEIIKNPDTTLESLLKSCTAPKGNLYDAFKKGFAWNAEVDFSDPKNESELLSQKNSIVHWMRTKGDYEAARVMMEEELKDGFAKGREKLQEKRPDLRKEAVRTVSKILSEGGEGQSVYELWNKQNIPQEQQEKFVKGLIDAETDRLMNATVAKEYIKKDMFTGGERELWLQYNDMLDPKGEWLNISDENSKMIMKEVAINGLLIIASGGVASIARAGVTRGLSIGARAMLGTERFKLMTTAFGILGNRGSMLGRSIYRGVGLSGAAAGLLVEGAAFEATHMGLQGEWLGSQLGWVQKIFWSSASLGVFKAAGKVGEGLNAKIGKTIEGFLPKMADKKLAMGIQKLFVAGHAEVAAMLMIGAVQKGYFALEHGEEFEWDWADELLHAYITVGALKVDGGIIHGLNKSWSSEKSKVKKSEVTKVSKKNQPRVKQVEASTESAFDDLIVQKADKINAAYDEIIAKLPEGTAKLPKENLEGRLAFILGLPDEGLTLKQKRTILSAHFVGIAEGRGIGTHTFSDISKKGRKLEGEFDKNQRRLLIEKIQMTGAEIKGLTVEEFFDKLGLDHGETLTFDEVTFEIDDHHGCFYNENDGLIYRGRVFDNQGVGVLADNSPISDVKPLLSYLGTGVYNRNEVAEVVEPPLLRAAEMLFDKNIRTTGSSANGKDIKVGYVFLEIDYASLSPRNQEIARKLCGDFSEQVARTSNIDGTTSEEVIQRIDIKIPVTEASTVGEVEAASIAIVNQFESQPLTWATVKTLEEMYDFLGRPEEGVELDGNSEELSTGYYYDPVEELFYASRYQYDRVHEDSS